MRRKIIRLSTILTILLGMIFIFGLGLYSLSSTPDANLTVKEAWGKAGTSNNLVSIEVTSNVAVRGIQFTLKDDPDVLIPTTVSLNPPVSGASIDKQDYPVEGLSVIIESDSGIVIPAGGKQRIDILYNVAANTPDMQVALAPIDVKLADKDVNPITTTVSNSYFSIRPPETIPPTIYGPYVGDLCHHVAVDDKSFGSNVEMCWSHSDNLGGSGIDINSVRVWCIEATTDISTDLTPPPSSVASSGGSFIFPASSLAGGPYKIKIRVCDMDMNYTETTADVSVPTSDTCKPTIDGLYYYYACPAGSIMTLGVDGAIFYTDVMIYWSHSDNSGGLCRDSDINKTTGRVEITGPNGYYENLTPSATIAEPGGQVTFPVSRLVSGEYTIKIGVCDKNEQSPNCAEVTATVHVGNPYPNNLPTTPTNLKVDSVTSSSITWSWNAVSGATSYDFNVYSGGTCSSTRSGGSTSDATPTLTANRLSSSTPYSLKVRACNSSGWSDWSSCAPGTTE
jgi:hypothetical protein